MRITHFEVMRQPSGSRLAVYTVRIARREFIVTRQLGLQRIRLNRISHTSGATEHRPAR
jgi:hypothetical protein